MLNAMALDLNVGNLIMIELVYVVSGQVVSKSSFTGILREKPSLDGYSHTGIYGLVHKAGYTVIDTSSNCGGLRIICDNTQRIPLLTAIQEVQ